MIISMHDLRDIQHSVSQDTDQELAVEEIKK